MTIERKWEAVASQSLTADGTTNGIITIADTKLWRVGQALYLRSNTQTEVLVRVERITSSTTMRVVSAAPNCSPTPIDISAYLLADAASIDAFEQNTPRVSPEETARAAFDFEPVNAFRVRLVDEYGDPASTGGGGPSSSVTVSSDVTKGIDVQWDDLQITSYTACDQPAVVEARYLGVLVRTLTLTYDSEDRLIQVVKT